MQYRGLSVQDASQQVLDTIRKLGGTGGLIVMDRQGNIAQLFNTSGMYRGRIGVEGKPEIAIYK